MQQSNRRYFFKRVFIAAMFFPFNNLYSKLAGRCPQGDPTSDKIKKKLIDERNKKRVDYFPYWKDAKNHDKFTEGANCDNCSFYKADKQEPTFGRCTMAAMKYVPSCGWCKLYKKAPKKTTKT